MYLNSKAPSLCYTQQGAKNLLAYQKIDLNRGGLKSCLLCYKLTQSSAFTTNASTTK